MCSAGFDGQMPLQVLVSIQGLIMVAQPYFNEPGFESIQVPTSLFQKRRTLKPFWQ
jgi:hypothetical protein